MGTAAKNGRADREVIPETAPHVPGQDPTPVEVLCQGSSLCEERWLGLQGPCQGQGGRYIDKKCPFTGNVSIRGKILRGVVHRCFMKITITVRRDYLHYITKYRRYEKRHKMISAHCAPCFDVVPGDEVMIGECRPLSKTVRFNVLEVHEKADRTGAKAAH